VKILFLSPYVPSQIRVRPYNFIRALARRGHQITLICSSGKGEEQALTEIRSHCAKLIHVPLTSRRMLANALRALPSGLPLQATLNLDPELLRAIRAEVAQGSYDVAHIEHLRGSALKQGLANLPTLLDSVDSISLLFERTVRSSPSWKSRLMARLDLQRTRAYEAAYTRNYDQVIVSSPEDAASLEELRSTHGHLSRRSPVVIANGVDLHYFAPQQLARQPGTIVFSGKMGYHANEAAALFLVQEIMPLIWARLPEAHVTIAGSSPPASVLALKHDARVEVTGFLPDLRPVIAQAAVAACPLRYGVGIQNKVLEAMAMETPVVAARQAARALSAIDGRDLLLATTAEEYAQALLTLLENQQRAAAIGVAGRRYVEQYHDWDVAAERLELLYQGIARPQYVAR
jgi:glycosyltransferase involved in cell wall biosynthesis